VNRRRTPTFTCEPAARYPRPTFLGCLASEKQRVKFRDNHGRVSACAGVILHDCRYTVVALDFISRLPNGITFKCRLYRVSVHVQQVSGDRSIKGGATDPVGHSRENPREYCAFRFLSGPRCQRQEPLVKTWYFELRVNGWVSYMKRIGVYPPLDAPSVPPLIEHTVSRNPPHDMASGPDLIRLSQDMLAPVFRACISYVERKSLFVGLAPPSR